MCGYRLICSCQSSMAGEGYSSIMSDFTAPWSSSVSSCPHVMLPKPGQHSLQIHSTRSAAHTLMFGTDLIRLEGHWGVGHGSWSEWYGAEPAYRRGRWLIRGGWILHSRDELPQHGISQPVSDDLVVTELSYPLE